MNLTSSLRSSGVALLICSAAAIQGQTFRAAVTPVEAASSLPLLQEAEASIELPATKVEGAAVSSSLEDASPSMKPDASRPLPGEGQLSSGDLPEAPSAAESRTSSSEISAAYAFQAPVGATPNIAPKLTKYIPAGWTAQTINGHDKVLIGLRDLYSPLNFVAMVASAGYEHVLNGEPNYGTDRGAFGQRLGAAAIRESTQGFFTDSVFSPIFHEDPRYYVQGVGHSFVYRTMYAITRPLITRTDSGKSSVNGALLAGYAASTALTYTYYPQINRNFHDTAATFGGSLGGAALGFFVSEMSDDVLKAIHIRK